MKFFLFSTITIMILYFPAIAQVLQVTADVEYEHMQSDEQEILSDFDLKIEQYFNNYLLLINDWYKIDSICFLRYIIKNLYKNK